MVHRWQEPLVHSHAHQLRALVSLLRRGIDLRTLRLRGDTRPHPASGQLSQFTRGAIAVAWITHPLYRVSSSPRPPPAGTGRTPPAAATRPGSAPAAPPSAVAAAVSCCSTG